MTIVRRLIRLWLAVAIGAGLTQPPISNGGAAVRVLSTNAAPPACAALAPSHPVAAAGVTRGELRLDGVSRSQQKTCDLVEGSAARALTPAGLLSIGHRGPCNCATASTFALRGPPRSA